MKKWNRILAVLCLTALLSSNAVTASANTIEKEPEIPVTIASNSNVAQPYSDVIETKYRGTPWGGIQCRRWNATRGYWVDPFWIDLP